ncbi:MAG: hypothetical protein ACXVBU_17400 [Ktedonobacteraceae bacterium]
MLSNGIKSAGEIYLISILPWLANHILRIPTEREARSLPLAPSTSALPHVLQRVVIERGATAVEVAAAITYV